MALERIGWQRVELAWHASRMLLDQRQARDASARTPIEHPWSVPERAVPPLQSLVEMFPTAKAGLPSDYQGRHHAILEWLGHRVTWRALTNWRRGSRKMPVWAIDALVAGARQQAKKWTAIAEALEKQKPAE